jgi:hypothetical protein
MPNWCCNSISITHEDTSKVDALEDVLKKNIAQSEDEEQDESIGVLMHLLPRPDSENENWYSWNIENWGTKWDIQVFDYERDDNYLMFSFDSAWSPPVALYKTLYEQGWDIDAQYFESGYGFVGEFSDGFDEYYEYDFDDENWRDEIPEDLIEYAYLESEYEFYLECQEESE